MRRSQTDPRTQPRAQRRQSPAREHRANGIPFLAPSATPHPLAHLLRTRCSCALDVKRRGRVPKADAWCPEGGPRVQWDALSPVGLRPWEEVPEHPPASNSTTQNNPHQHSSTNSHRGVIRSAPAAWPRGGGGGGVQKGATRFPVLGAFLDSQSHSVHCDTGEVRGKFCAPGPQTATSVSWHHRHPRWVCGSLVPTSSGVVLLVLVLVLVLVTPRIDSLKGLGPTMHQRNVPHPPEAVRQAVGGDCQSGWGRLLLVTNAIEAVCGWAL